MNEFDCPETHYKTMKKCRVVRTKFFFKARYLWHADHYKDKSEAARAEGIRVDVNEPPNWMKHGFQTPLEDNGHLAPGFINSYAMNIYHDGSEGIGQHFDDIKRFDRPITTLRLFSPSRLTFGALGFAMTNSQFFIPMPRGCVTQMLKGGFAADGIKHCIRHADMVCKSVALMMRRIHEHLLREAEDLKREHVERKEQQQGAGQGAGQGPCQHGQHSHAHAHAHAGQGADIPSAQGTAQGAEQGAPEVGAAVTPPRDGEQREVCVNHTMNACEAGVEVMPVVAPVPTPMPTPTPIPTPHIHGSIQHAASDGDEPPFVPEAAGKAGGGIGGERHAMAGSSTGQEAGVPAPARVPLLEWRPLLEPQARSAPLSSA